MLSPPVSEIDTWYTSKRSAPHDELAANVTADDGSRGQPVIIYRDTLLPASERFVYDQAEALRTFTPIYAGLRCRAGITLPAERQHVLCSDGIQRARFKFFGPTSRQREVLAKCAPALLHAHFAEDACDVIKLARRLNIPLVVSLHGYDVTTHDDHLNRLYLIRRSRLWRAASRFICVSGFIKARALVKGVPGERAVIHYTGTDTEWFCPDPAVPREPVVLFVGRLVASKGCEYLIRAMARVQAILPKTRLVIIGDGILRRELEALASSMLTNVRFLGVQPVGVVKEWMNRATVFSVPSVTDEAGRAEGFGMVFTEAQAMGLPVVSSRVGGIPEAVADEQTGFLVPERDSEAISARILDLLGNRDLWVSFSEAGRSRVERRFNAKKQSLLLEAQYYDVLALWKSRGWNRRMYG